ncbi:MAG: CoA-binding protein [Dehalococcoidia bacterium]
MRTAEQVKNSTIERLDYLFNPRSVAVIGASNTFGKWGFNIFNHVLASAPERRVYPVNVSASEVIGFKASAHITDIHDEIDLAVVTVPPEQVIDALRECVAKGVKVAEVITAGFEETGADGERLQKQMLEIAGSGGMRLVGPNSMGHLSTQFDFYTTPWITGTPKGGIGLISQSGNFGINIVRKGMETQLGFSKFISSGNEADLTLEDYLEYLGQDDDTEVIIAYIEGLRRGRRFFELSREITKHKPIVVLKAGRTASGARAVKSHTAALSGSDRIYEAAFRQAGVIRVNEVDEMLDVAGALIRQPLPKGRRVGILTGGGGPGVIATDACERLGLEIAAVSEGTLQKLDSILPPRWPRTNPVDMVGETNLTYPCLLALMEDDNVDAVISLAVGFADAIKTIVMGYMQTDVYTEVDQFIEQEGRRELEQLKRVIELMDTLHKPVFFFPPSGIEEFRTLQFLRENGVLTYPSTERGVRALARLVEYSDYLGGLEGSEQ